MVKTIQHKDLETKNDIFNVAEVLSNKDDFASKLSASILYMNLADYMASSIYNHLKLLTEEAVGKFYLSDVQVRLKSYRKKDMTLGQVMEELKAFNFPKSAQFLDLLDKVNEARKPIVHRIVTTPRKDINKIDKAIDDVCRYSVELINLGDDIIINEIPNITTVIDIAKN